MLTRVCARRPVLPSKEIDFEYKGKSCVVNASCVHPLLGQLDR